MSSFSNRRLWITTLLVGLGSSGLAQSKPYPQPQVATARGEMAPDFTLSDQDGNNFRLSDQRGRWVLLFFYTGYW